MSRGDAQWFIYIILIICGLSYYGYKQWSAPPPTAIIGKAWVIDGDTVVISDIHIRLEGIDAPETDQTCTDANGKSWPCGQTATRELRGFIGGRELTCDKRAEDRYGRTLAVCKLPDGSDVNAWLVHQGWALATGFVKMYESEQDEAEAAKCDRQIRRLLALENAAGVDADQAVRIDKIASIAHQATSRSKFSVWINRRHRMA
jgi:Staphylococcal nuclease homologue